MAGRTSCIVHPENDDFLIIRRHYLRMFGGDVDFAALVSLFEYWTNGELGQFAKHREEGVPWVTVDMPTIESWMMGVCKRRTIQDKLSLLDEMGILRSATPGAQSVKSYLLNQSELNSMIANRIVLIGKSADVLTDSKEVIGKNGVAFADHFGKFADPRYGSLDNTNGGYKNKEEKNYNSLPSSSETQSQNTSSPTLDTEPVDPETGEVIETRKTKTRWRPSPRKKEPRVGNGMSERMRQLRQTAQDEAGAGMAALPTTVRTSDATKPDTAPPMDFPGRWNELVPSAQVDRVLLAPNPKAYRDPVFLSRYDEICRKAQEYAAAGSDITLGFLLRQDEKAEGRYRWQQLLAGELSWLLPKRPAGPKPADGVAIAAKIRAEIKLKKEQEDAARAKATDQIAG